MDNREPNYRCFLEGDRAAFDAIVTEHRLGLIFFINRFVRDPDTAEDIAVDVFVYVLVQDVESAERRAIALRNVGANPFAQPYRDFTTNAEPLKEQRDLARWINHKAIFKTVKTFNEYRGARA